MATRLLNMQVCLQLDLVGSPHWSTLIKKKSNLNMACAKKAASINVEFKFAKLKSQIQPADGGAHTLQNHHS